MNDIKTSQYNAENHTWTLYLYKTLQQTRL